MLFRRDIWMFRRNVYCSGGFYAVHGGYIFLGVLYAVQEGYMNIREGYMMKK